MIILRLRSKLAAAIEATVKREMDRERDVIFSLQDAIKQTGVQLSDRIRYLEQLTEELNKRIQDLERK